MNKTTKPDDETQLEEDFVLKNLEFAKGVSELRNKIYGKATSAEEDIRVIEVLHAIAGERFAAVCFALGGNTIEQGCQMMNLDPRETAEALSEHFLNIANEIIESNIEAFNASAPAEVRAMREKHNREEVQKLEESAKVSAMAGGAISSVLAS